MASDCPDNPADLFPIKMKYPLAPTLHGFLDMLESMALILPSKALILGPLELLLKTLENNSCCQKCHSKQTPS